MTTSTIQSVPSPDLEWWKIDRSRWTLGKDGWRAVLKSTGTQFGQDDVATLSAAVTLRIVLSLVPALLAAIAIAAQVISPADIRELVTSAGSVIPGSAQDFVTTNSESAIESLQEKGAAALVVSIATGIFAASSAAVMLIKALNVAYDEEEKRGFVGQRSASLAVIGALALSLFGMFVAVVVGPTLLEFLLPQSIIDSPLNILITLGRFLAAVVILMLFFGFAFYAGPAHSGRRLRFLTPGAVLGVVGWLVLSYLFSLYVRVAGSYSATYGAVAGVIVLLVWLNYSFIVLIMGAELDSEIDNFLAPVVDGSVPMSVLLTRAPAPAVSATLPATTDAGDPDRIDPAWPRHPGLMPGATAGQVDADGPTLPGLDTPSAPLPPIAALAGAAKSTSGAAVAATIWRQLRKR